MTDQAASQGGLMRWLKNEAREWAYTLAWAIPAYLAFSTVAFAAYKIPSESMVPTLEVGDRIIVSKFAYGYSRESLPFDLGRVLPDVNARIFAHMPKRGDVVVFRHPSTSEVLVKRLVGLPGDTIEVRAGTLIINGAPVKLKALGSVHRIAHTEYGDRPEEAIRRQETFPDGVVHDIDEYSDTEPADNFGPYKVPEGYVFMMGDNRDNSADSRFPTLGPIPIENLIGRAEFVFVSTNFCNPNAGYDCPLPRLFKPLAPKP